MHIPTNEAGNVVTKLVMGYFRKKFPYTPDNNISPNQLADFSYRYKYWYLVSALIAMILFFTLTALYIYVIYNLYLFLHSVITSSPAIFFHAAWTSFILPGIFLMFSTLSPIMTVVMRFFLKDDHDIYQEYQNQKEQYDGKKTMRFFSKIFVYPFVLTLMLANTASIVAYPDEFKYKTVLDRKTHTYRYSEIQHITYFLNYSDKQGEKMYAPHHKLFFKDHTDLATDLYFDKAEEAVPFIDLLVSKGIPIDSAEVDK